MTVVAGDREEYLRRVAAVQKLMAAEGFDALLVADDDDHSRPPRGRTRYLSNFSAGLRPLAVVVPTRGEPTLIVPPGALHCVFKWAAARSWIRDIRCSPQDRWPPPMRSTDDIVEAIRSYGLSGSRVGLCGDFPDEEELRRRLPEVRFEPAVQADARGIRRDIIERVRAFKSPWEVAWLEEAQRCADIGIRAFMAAVAPGLRQDWVVAEAEYQARRAGAEGAFVFMSAGTKPWVWETYRGELRFAEGDLVAVEFNARVNGYVAQIARSGVLGKPTPAQRRVLEAARESERRMIEQIAIGVTGGELWEVGLRVVKEAGLAPYGRYGHGMGLSIAESFDIMPGERGAVQEGYCIEVHAGVVNLETMDSALVGDQLVIEGGKVRLLSRVPQDLGPSWA